MKDGWKGLLKASIRDAEGLREFLHLTDTETEKLAEIVESYPLCVNPYYLSLVNKEDPEDPIRKMCIPDIREFSRGGQTDTSGEADNTVMQGLQHKYKQTALILSTNQCAMYCRHCFRKRMVGLSSDETAEHLPEMAGYVRSHKEINNVLISGGDSFLNSNGIIEEYLQFFCEIPHLDFIRFGTRVPVVLPQRITEDGELCKILETYGGKKQIIIVTQFNHPHELTWESVRAVKMLKKAGCIIRNQTVLLKGVNDDSETMAQLMNGLVSYGIIPYYIFQCRPVEGVKNQFQVPFVEGIELIEKARKKMNGQSKSVRYVLSHPTGKIEIVGRHGRDQMIFKYHQAKYEEDHGRIFIEKVGDSQCWLGRLSREISER